MSKVDTARWAKRRLVDEAQFLAPLLRKGLRVLDVGCGPGSMTRDIAERVTPGWVIGVDTNEDRVAMARQIARESNLQNVRFHVADAAALPLSASAVDIVFANGLVEHLQDPAVVVEEFYRVLRKGGRVALRSPDWGATILEPTSPTLRASIDLRNRWQRHHHGDPEAGRKLKGLLRRAGFTDITVRAEAMHEEPSTFRDYMHRMLGDPELAALSTRHGWSSSTDTADMISAWSAWATHPDAFASSFWCHAIANKST